MREREGKQGSRIVVRLCDVEDGLSGSLFHLKHLYKERGDIFSICVYVTMGREATVSSCKGFVLCGDDSGTSSSSTRFVSCQ